ncbi:MAG: alpha/beta hydrolase [Bacteroidetes bacterium]|nr:MAG: alpha/beta hydrolase [Bacteroidota bacterium]
MRKTETTRSDEQPQRPRRHYFRYLVSALFILWIIAIQAGCLTMRTPDREWAAELQQKGQFTPPDIYDIDITGYRTIHAVSMPGPDTLPLVVLVHGSPGSADAFLSYLADSALLTRSRLVTVDRPGFGYTSGFGKPEGSLERQAAALDAVVSKMSPDRKVLLVGHSLGGPVIARYAMDFPEKTGGLILVAGSIDPDQEKHPWWQGAVDVPPLRWLTPRSLWASNREIILLEDELRAILPRWTDIRCPVTMVHARDDRLVPFANVAFGRSKLVNSVDFETVTLEKGDHFILWTQPAVIRQAILDMLGQHFNH